MSQPTDSTTEVSCGQAADARPLRAGCPAHFSAELRSPLFSYRPLERVQKSAGPPGGLKPAGIQLGMLLAVWLLLQSGSASADMIIRGYDAKLHDRFYTGLDKAFIGEAYDWSGVGKGGGWFAAAITPDYFLSANHAHPGNGTSITFYHGNDPSGAFESRVVASGVRIGTSDLWLGRLQSPLSANVATYPILQLPSIPSYYGLEIYNYGKSNRVGRNNIDPFTIAHYTVGGAGDGIGYQFDYDSPLGGVGDDETFLQNGDSGGPSFAIQDGELKLVGIHWAIDAFNEVSYDTFVPEHYDAVMAAVPEPSSLLLVSLGALAQLAWLRGRKRLAAAATSDP